jgi:hypothetical protein
MSKDKDKDAGIKKDTAPGLASAKLQVMSEVGYCLKTKSQNLNYTYASESELIAALRPALIDHDLTVHPVGCELLESVQYETRRGGTMFLARVRATYRLIHAPSGESEDITVFGEGGDVGDKSLPKAMTCAYKYAIRQAFLIETGDDPDKHASQPGVAKMEAVDPPQKEWSEKKLRDMCDKVSRMDDLTEPRRYLAEEQRKGNLRDDQIKAVNRVIAERQAQLDNSSAPY